MIVYVLGCENQHRFEGWFASSADFERQQNEKLLSCPLCGSGKIDRLPHVPYVNTGRSGESQTMGKTPPAGEQYTNIGTDLMLKLIDHILENTEDVGAAFPEEARKIHYGEAPERGIRGTASRKEVEALQEEGIEVAALPIPLHRLGKTH